jgi:hypothetical protein
LNGISSASRNYTRGNEKYHGPQHLSNPWSGSRHADALHPPHAKGWVIVGSKASGSWEQEGYHAWELDFLFWDRRGERDLYMTQNRFRTPEKATSQLRELVALYSDCDYYKVARLKDRTPEAVLREVLERLEESGIPPPALALSSGRGLQLVWPFARPLPREELQIAHWQRAQLVLYGLLKAFGADHGATDASRVLRVVGSVNGKNGQAVAPLRALGPRWAFGELAEKILPQEPTLEISSSEAAEVFPPALKLAAPPSSKTGRPGPHNWTVRSLMEARLADYQTLRRLRYGEGRMEDFRDRWLFLSGVAASWITWPPDAARFEREMIALAYEVGGWDEKRTRSKLQAVFKRMRMYEGGESVELAGVALDPRYLISNRFIIEMLEITPEEERHMLTVISKGEKYRRKRKNEDEKRRKNRGGKMSRSERAAYRRTEARRMAAEGLSFGEIAQALGISFHSVNSYVYGRR